MMLRDESKLVDMATAYCAANGVEITTLGRIIVNDGKFFDRLKGGGGCTNKTFNRVVTWFKDNQTKKSKSKKEK